MNKLPALTVKQLISILGKLEFEVIRIKGSHHVVRHKDGRSSVVPSSCG
jgi:predicted RNA binding protein YcfA (HicA-like mRNA interferase family)